MFIRKTLKFFRKTLMFFRKTSMFLRKTLMFFRETSMFFRETLMFLQLRFRFFGGQNSYRHFSIAVVLGLPLSRNAVSLTEKSRAVCSVGFILNPAV